MDLTSSTLRYAVGLLTLVCVAATVSLWPRLAHGGARWILARLGAVVLSQLSLVTLVALMLNAYGDFYPTWSDLLGSDDAQTVAVGRTSGAQDGGTGPAVGAVDAPGPGVTDGRHLAADGGSRLVLPRRPTSLDRWPDLPGGPPEQVGRFSSVTVLGERTGYHQQAYVYLPPQYFQPAFQQTDFPVITSYVGYPGSIQALVGLLKLPQTAAQLMQRGQLPPTILVLISQTLASPRDTECVDAVQGPQVETYLTTDYRTALRSAYRISADPASWALMGFSEGGTCALETALRHPDQFGLAASMGGEYRDYETAQSGNLFGPTGPARDALVNSYDLAWRLQQLPAPDVQLLVATTVHGERDYASTEQFLKLVKPPLRATPLLLSSGGHNFGTWTVELPPTLIWLGEHLAPPGPAAATDRAATRSPLLRVAPTSGRG